MTAVSFSANLTMAIIDRVHRCFLFAMDTVVVFHLLILIASFNRSHCSRSPIGTTCLFVVYDSDSRIFLRIVFLIYRRRYDNIYCFVLHDHSISEYNYWYAITINELFRSSALARSSKHLLLSFWSACSCAITISIFESFVLSTFTVYDWHCCLMFHAMLWTLRKDPFYFGTLIASDNEYIYILSCRMIDRFIDYHDLIILSMWVVCIYACLSWSHFASHVWFAYHFLRLLLSHIEWVAFEGGFSTTHTLFLTMRCINRNHGSFVCRSVID